MKQKQQHIACCQDWMENEGGSNFLQRVITGDEAWIYEYDPETRRQSEEWKHSGSPHSKKVRKSFKNQDHDHCFFFEEWSIMNLFPKVKQLMPHFMWKF
jgi:hypothetical protein